MFFSISKSKQSNFPNHYVFDHWVINTDNGWTIKTINGKNVLYKGYCDTEILDNIIEKILYFPTPIYDGNFCCFVINEDFIQIKTDTHRNFPLYYNEKEITNVKNLKNQIYTNELVIIDSYFDFKINKYKNFEKVDTSTLSEQEIIEKIDNILEKKIKFVLSNTRMPKKIFLSGGLDSLLVYSYAVKYTEIEIIKGEHFEFDYFWLKNHGYLSRNWSYKQMCHYKEPTFLLVGTPGDEFMLRGPETVNMYCQVNNINVLDLLTKKDFENCYHKMYFLQEKNIKIFSKKIFKLQKNKQYCYNYICNWLMNDFQHFHLGNTITFTPLRDIKILQLMLKLPLDIAIKQIMDGYVTKKLIEKNDSNLLKYISKYKNTNNHMENLIDLIT